MRASLVALKLNAALIAAIVTGGATSTIGSAPGVTTLELPRRGASPLSISGLGYGR